MSCNICCDNYNKSNRTKVCCPYCNFDVCRTCCETYILSETIPKCMNTTCAKEWSRKFLREAFTNVFLTSKYKEHLEDVLFDREKALMPATQPLVEEIIRKKNVNNEIKTLDNLILDLQKQRRQLERSLINGAYDNVPTERAKFIRQCPAEGCRGFLSTQWKCGICEQWSCPDCHELKGKDRDCEHKCDPNSVETAKLLAKDSKPCPKCQSMIFKIEGCDQMWCTQCHTAFSWRTGHLEKNIHNPHFYEWQRKNNGGTAPRNPGDIQCGRELDHYTADRVRTASRKHKDLCSSRMEKYEMWRGGTGERERHTYTKKVDDICNIIRNLLHNVHVELPRFQTDYVTANQDLRVEYLQNNLSEKAFKIQIQRNDKKNKKNTEIAQVIQLLNTAVTDIVYRIINNLETAESGCHNLDELRKEFNEIRNYCNDIFKDISYTYGTTCYEFNAELEFKIKPKEKKKASKKMDDSNNNDEDSDVDNDDNKEDNKGMLDTMVAKLSATANRLMR